MSYKIIVRKLFRLPYILQLRENFRNYKILTFFETPYRKILSCNCCAKCILDIVRDGQTGYTMRTMESIVFKKKLLTNNPYVKTMPEYAAGNMFILGEDSVDELKDFLNKEYVDPKTDISRYGISAWFNRFFDSGI